MSAPEQRRRKIRHVKPDIRVTRFDTLRNRVYPMLKPVDVLVAVREQQLPMLVYQLFLANIIITYVIDEGDSVRYINEEHLERWQIDQPTLHTQALENLYQRTAFTEYTTVGKAEQRLLIYNSQDGYDATRLLLSSLLAAWQAELPGHMVIGIPNRDFLIAFSDYHTDTVRKIAYQIQLDMVQHASGLTDQLFTIVDGEVQEYIW